MMFALLSHLQKNGIDCGVFTMIFASKLSAGSDIEDVQQPAIANARIKIASQLLEGTI